MSVSRRQNYRLSSLRDYRVRFCRLPETCVPGYHLSSLRDCSATTGERRSCGAFSAADQCSPALGESNAGSAGASLSRFLFWLVKRDEGSMLDVRFADPSSPELSPVVASRLQCNNGRATLLRSFLGGRSMFASLRCAESSAGASHLPMLVCGWNDITCSRRVSGSFS